jgi:hypothetical protein
VYRIEMIYPDVPDTRYRHTRYDTDSLKEN